MRATLLLILALTLAGCASTDDGSTSTTTTTPAAESTTTTTQGTTTTSTTMTTTTTTTTTPPTQGATTTTTPPTTSGSAPMQAAVDIASFRFGPATVTIAAGGTVTWTNRDSAPHTATADDGAFDSGTLEQGATFQHAFPTPGEYEYRCDIHSSMRGTVVVR